MTDFLLIHGAAHGAWCWRDVIPALQTLGHSARAIDLPGHGDDKTPYTNVTLDAYRDAILAAIDTPVTLVGHSMGGYPITAAAESAPDKIERLVYLCAYVPAPGLSLAQRRMQAAQQPLLPAIRMADDRKGWTVAPDMIEPLFYHDCPPETLAYAAPRLCVQATQPTAVPVPTTARYDSVPRHYIRCTDDRTIPPDFQAEMVQDWPNGTVHSMDTAHSPFFADPDGLAGLLNIISKG